MSLLEVARVGALAKSIRLAAAGGLILGVAMLGGCGWQPLYGPTASGAQLEDVMRTVDITTIPGRVGQRVRNELIFKTTNGGEAADKSKYRLDISVKESLINTLVSDTGDPKSQVFQLYSQFRLIRLSDNEVVLEGHSNSRAAYDKVDSVFADIRARRDAEDRTARTIAEAIRTRLAAYFSTNA
ncbi:MULTISPECIES: LPS assembly lipoprotein LptE [Rhodomicrobium]|uniref:LPS assembly lipoprotein LptE n=1 Tax=Rhodomicrobium TaxID=1068 RepID=UPI000B4B0B90|nr:MULTISPECIES: LPS assembly lipoprotein LptE [Rhodomicrobium]